MACMRPWWRSSWGCGTAWPSYGLPSRGSPRLGACQRRRKSMRARKARSGRYCVACLLVSLWSAKLNVPGWGGWEAGEGGRRGVRVKVVLLVVHPSCAHCHSRVQQRATSACRGGRSPGVPYEEAHPPCFHSTCCRICRCRSACRPWCHLCAHQRPRDPRRRSSPVRDLIPMYCSGRATCQS